MNIVVVTRCLNGLKYVERFLRGYDFADHIVVSDGGSTDGSIDLFLSHPKVTLTNFGKQEIIGGHIWNPDNEHIQHAIDEGCKLDPTWLILDDLDCVPNANLRTQARDIFSNCGLSQLHVYRLYLWGDHEYFPLMNNNFDPAYRSIWAWMPDEINIHTDLASKHGTLVGISHDHCILDRPYVLLHKSWHPDTVQEKMDRYNAIGLPMDHPLTFAGIPEPLPEWAVE